jgi:hypothetical protein
LEIVADFLTEKSIGGLWGNFLAGFLFSGTPSFAPLGRFRNSRANKSVGISRDTTIAKIDGGAR